ncbi:O-antigen ligase family protein [Sphingomonas endophytica]|uniref:O-antigen ligase-related domain-containing protein n=1 Tax=Sphingomonas endophytica TaxID=869719 RepID=A0A147I3C2_9SPHN|nr:O-antigen ligase family protein [Sphingomonas endophytica]KTT72488.1 hypothetical protein NS334_09105 [Sphingomonas endophytica]
MKWIALLVVLGLLPGAIGWLRANPRHLPRVMTALGIMQFVTGVLHLVIAPISWGAWPGYAKGLELSLIDAFAVALIASAPKGTRVAHLRWPIAIYAVIVLFSAIQTDVPMPTFFYAWQLGRMIVLITAVAYACRDPRAPEALIRGLIFGLAYQSVMSMIDRAQGAVQAAGTFGHQNLLGMLTYFALFPALAIMLSKKKAKWMWLGPLAAAVVIILAASRATIGLAGAGFVLLLVLSMVRRPTPRKTSIAVAGLIALAVAAPLAMTTLGERFNKDPLPGDYDERAAFERAATMMREDHPLGVGANHYVIVANTKGYSDRAGVAPVYGSRSAHVHNVYLLNAAETGYPGLIAFVVMMVWPIIVALRCSWRFRRDPRGELLLGLAVTLTIVCLHSFYEWIFVTYNAEYMYALAVGLIAGLSQQMGYWTPRRVPRRAIRTGPDDPADTPPVASPA